MRRRQFAAVPWLLLGPALSPSAGADPNLWSLLRNGGQVILMRHSQTDPGVGDPPGMVLDDCSTQRNLSKPGRVHAREVGRMFRQQGVEVEQLLSSPWCRCLDTARLAFQAEPQVSAALGNLFGREDPKGRQVQRLKPLVSGKPAKGNRVLVSHGSTILALTGTSLDPGELLILTPQGAGQFAVAGRLVVPAPGSGGPLPAIAPAVTGRPTSGRP